MSSHNYYRIRINAYRSPRPGERLLADMAVKQGAAVN